MNTPLSPRNKIPCPAVYGGSDVLIEIDTLFEICDAQFNSERQVHAVFARCTRQGPQDTPALVKRATGAFLPYVRNAARPLLGELPHMLYSDHNLGIVAKALAELWVKNHQTEHRLQKGKR